MPIPQGAWEVRAGIIPGLPLSEYTKSWFYTSIDYERDRLLGSTAEKRFDSLRAEAMRYYDGLVNPERLSWVQLSWVWIDCAGTIAKRQGAPAPLAEAERA